MAKGLDCVGNLRLTDVKYPKIFTNPVLCKGLYSSEDGSKKLRGKVVNRDNSRFFMFDVEKLKPGDYMIDDDRFLVYFQIDGVSHELGLKSVKYHERRKETQDNSIENQTSVCSIDAESGPARGSGENTGANQGASGE